MNLITNIMSWCSVCVQMHVSNHPSISSSQTSSYSCRKGHNNSATFNSDVGITCTCSLQTSSYLCRKATTIQQHSILMPVYHVLVVYRPVHIHAEKATTIQQHSILMAVYHVLVVYRPVHIYAERPLQFSNIQF